MKQNNASHEKNDEHKQKSSQTQKAFNVWGIVLAIWAVYRSTIGINSSLFFDEIILKPLLFITPVIFYITNVEHLSIAKGLWLEKKGLLKNLKIALLISIPVFILFFLFLFSSKGISVETILWLLPIALGMSMSEEILSRGFVARHIWEEKHSIVKTVVQASVLHMFLRIPRIMTMPELFGQKLILFVTADFLLSIVLTAIFLWRKSLVPVIVVRFLYSFLLMSMLA
jgi:hypothetical protein